MPYFENKPQIAPKNQASIHIAQQSLNNNNSGQVNRMSNFVQSDNKEDNFNPKIIYMNNLLEKRANP